MLFKKIFPLLVLFSVLLYSDPLVSELKNPLKKTFDFTYDDVDAEGEYYNPGEIVDKIAYEINAVRNLIPRTFSAYECPVDEYNTMYCPEALVKADSYWGYDESEVVTRKDTIEDRELGESIKHTGQVRDFVNGLSEPHVNTEINYSRGNSATHNGTVMDYTSRNSIPDKTPTTTIKCSYGKYDSISGQCIYGGLYQIVLGRDPDEEGYNYWKNDFSTPPTYTNILSFVRRANELKAPYICGYNLDTEQKEEVVAAYVWYLGRCPEQFGWDGWIINPDWNINLFIEKAQPECETRGVCPYTPPVVRTSPPIKTSECPSGFAYNSGSNVCKSTSPICPTGYSDTGSKCKKLISYKYYSYGCPVGYIVQNAGISYWNKTDPNTYNVNWYTLDDDVNSSVPPANNCVQSLNSTAYEYICGAGYQPISQGLLTCPSGSVGDCNSSQSPESNCYKDISYNFYEYGCSEGYITENYGLKTCDKVDPDGTKNNEATLNDDCNSATPPDGNCKKTMEFLYFEYICNGENEFGEEFTPIDYGKLECKKIDSDINSTNPELVENCNNPTPPANNCRALEYTCNSNEVDPAFVDNEWKCSPYLCNSRGRCGTASCFSYPPSKSFFMEQGMIPVKADYLGVCVSETCDMTMNKDISYCDAGENCPNVPGVYEKNGSCYYDDCPEGSYINSSGKCTVQ